MDKRLFIAVDLPEDIKKKIYKNSLVVKAECKRGSFERQDKYHITLAFIGSTPEERIPDMKEAMDACRCGSISIKADGISAFKGKAGLTLYQHVDAEKRLYNLRERLIKELIKRGFEPDVRKPFTPHITLARRGILKAGVTEKTLSEMTESAGFTADAMTLFSTEDGHYVPLYVRRFEA